MNAIPKIRGPLCDHSGDFQETVYVVASPHVHIHLLNDPEEVDRRGYKQLEFCCHGCGASVLVKYDAGSDPDGSAKDLFLGEHKDCPDSGFKDWCPGIRTSFSDLDLRVRPGRVGKGPFRMSSEHGDG